MIAICLALIDDEDDRHVFERLYRKLNKTVYFTALRITDTKEDAEDAAQNVWLYTAKNLDRIQKLQEHELDPYFITMSKHAAFNVLKKYKIRLVIADIPNNIDINAPTCQLELNLQVLSAFNEAQTTNERTTKGKRESRESGRYNPGRNLPIGYIKSNTPKEYEINKLESIIVKYIYDLAIYNIDYLNDINSLKISNTISVILRAISENFSLNKL